MEKWYTLIEVDRRAPEGVVMKAEVAAGSSWFSGHFPDEPILPGIAQLDMVRDAISWLHQKPLRVLGVRGVRFKRIIHPDERLTVSVCPKEGENSAYVFRITVEGERASNGILITEDV